MTTIKRATASTLMGLRWLLLAVASATVWLADVAEDAADKLDPSRRARR